MHPSLVHISSLDDPRVAPYRNLKDRELDRRGELFLAEGEYVVRRMLASDYPAESVLVADHRLPAIVDAVPLGVPLYVAPPSIVKQIVGFNFHTGIMACGRRKPAMSLDEVIPKNKQDLLLVICGQIANVENVGTLIRLSAGFGADAIVLGELCHDPFWRQSIRVSMGTIFKMPIVTSRDLVADIARLRNEWGVEVAATVLAPAFGNEAHGLTEAEVAACDRKVTIPMSLGTDSLNVGIAAGIFLYHFTQVRPGR
jgi:tRNA G18 (ribose-2'-O)-methylase SpoU